MLSVSKNPLQNAQLFPAIFYLLCYAFQRHVSLAQGVTTACRGGPHGTVYNPNSAIVGWLTHHLKVRMDYIKNMVIVNMVTSAPSIVLGHVGRSQRC